MPILNVTLKEGAPKDKLHEAKEESKKRGGEIKHEFTLIQGFTVEFPPDRVDALQTDEHIHVEQDGAVTTQ